MDGYEVEGKIGMHFPGKESANYDTTEIWYASPNGTRTPVQAVYVIPAGTTKAEVQANLDKYLSWRLVSSGTSTWQFVNTLNQDSRPMALIKIVPAKLLEFTVYHSKKITSISDVIARYTGEFTTGKITTTSCFTVANSTNMKLVSSNLISEKTKTGEDIYKTVIAASDSENGILLEDELYVFYLAHTNENNSWEHNVAYNDEDRVIARWGHSWFVQNTIGAQWQNDNGNGNGVCDGFIKIELKTKDIFDEDPVASSEIFVNFNDYYNRLEWTIKTNDINIEQYVDEYVLNIDSVEYRVSGSRQFDCSGLSNGVHTLSIYATAKSDPTITSNAKDLTFTVDVDNHVYNAESLDGWTPIAIYTPTANVKFKSIQFLSLYNSGIDLTVNKIVEMNDNNGTVIGSLKMVSCDLYKKKTADGKSLYKRVHALDSVSDLVLEAGKTYGISFGAQQWGANNSIVWNETSTTPVKTRESWGLWSGFVNSTHSVECKINVEEV